MNYSPKLKKAMQQIKNILDAEDIAGLVVLHTPGHTEFLNKLDPSYSCVFPDKYRDPSSGEMLDGFRIKAKSSELGIQKRNQLLHDTANMLAGINEVSGTLIMQNIEVEKLFEKNVEVVKGRGEWFSHEAQNN